MMASGSLNARVAIIKGGGKNLGAESARQLAPLEVHFALHYNSEKSKPGAKVFIQELTSKYSNIKVRLYSGDLRSGKNVEKLFQDVLKDFSQIDIVVNTVGMVLKKPITEISEAEYDTMFAINSKAAFLILQAGARYVAENGKLITIATSLLAAYNGLYTSYAGSKSAVEHLTRGVFKELKDRKVSVNAIAPGQMDTPFFYPQEPSDAVGFHKSQAMGDRLTDIKGIAPIVKFLCTEGSWISGQADFANGGYTTR